MHSFMHSCSNRSQLAWRENLLDFLELRLVLSTYDGELRDPLWSYKGHCGWNLYSRNEAEGQILRHKIQSHTNTIFFHFTRNYPSVSFKLPACHSFVSPFLWAKGSTGFRFLQRPPSSGSYDRAALVAQR